MCLYLHEWGPKLLLVSMEWNEACPGFQCQDSPPALYGGQGDGTRPDSTFITGSIAAHKAQAGSG